MHKFLKYDLKMQCAPFFIRGPQYNCLMLKIMKTKWYDNLKLFQEGILKTLYNEMGPF